MEDRLSYPPRTSLPPMGRNGGKPHNAAEESTPGCRQRTHRLLALLLLFWYLLSYCIMREEIPVAPLFPVVGAFQHTRQATKLPEVSYYIHAPLWLLERKLTGQMIIWEIYCTREEIGRSSKRPAIYHIIP